MLGVTEALLIECVGRQTTEDALVTSDTVLISQVVLEKLDLLFYESLWDSRKDLDPCQTQFLKSLLSHFSEFPSDTSQNRLWTSTNPAGREKFFVSKIPRTSPFKVNQKLGKSCPIFDI